MVDLKQTQEAMSAFASLEQSPEDSVLVQDNVYLANLNVAYYHIITF